MSACPPRGSSDAPPGLPFSDGDFPVRFMRTALAQACRARGRTSPNPPVGAVVVRDGTIVGAGHTQPPGQAHAEVVALAEAGERACGGTLYVTLEPCAHHGRTPPCTEAIIAAGIRSVIVAVRDPFPLVNGAGIAQLREAGIMVQVGMCASEAWEVIAGFVKRVRTGLPLVTAKYAMTLDGRIATRTGDSRWVTGETARRTVHQLRDTHDAVLVGAGTVRADDPLLTTRLHPADAGAGGPHHPLRVVISRNGELPPHAKLLDRTVPGTTLIACARLAPAARDRLTATGVEVAVLPAPIGDSVDLHGLLTLLAARGIATVLVEGGGTTLGALFDGGLVDCVVAYIAPVIVGGAAAPGPVGGAGVTRMADAWQLDDATVTHHNHDLCITGYLPQARGWRALPNEEG